MLQTCLVTNLTDGQVLVEGVNPRNPAEAMGRTSHNKLCFFPGSGPQLKGQIVTVHINEVRAYSLFGSIVSQQAPMPSVQLASPRAGLVMA